MASVLSFVHFYDVNVLAQDNKLHINIQTQFKNPDKWRKCKDSNFHSQNPCKSEIRFYQKQSGSTQNEKKSNLVASMAINFLRLKINYMLCILILHS